ncbi:MAG: sensor histidine kinase KdpD [Actinomycetota bacterium]
MDEGTATRPTTEMESVESLVGRPAIESILGTVWTHKQAVADKRAPLRIYLGAAPGVGKTYAMLDEGQRRLERGSQVVIGVVETYDRPKTKALAEGLEVVPTKTIEYRGVLLQEMDTDAVIRRHPDLALVDELAHTNVPGVRRAKRWEDALDILAEGIEVITTLNVQHIESLNDVVAKATGIQQRETVPDWILDIADQVELVDMSPHALRRRMMHGNVYPDARKAELALRRFFTEENLTALRELALMRVANQVDEDLLSRWTKGAIPDTRERVLVCVSRPELAEDLVRRGARVAQRAHGDLLVVNVTGTEERGEPGWIAGIRDLTSKLDGEFEVIRSDSVLDGVIGYAVRQHITQIVVGEPLRPRWQEILRGSFVNRLIRAASEIDIHVIARRER